MSSTTRSDRFKSLKDNLTGGIVLRGDPGYDDACRIWNAMIRKRPLAIVRCANTQDVVQAVSFARDENLPLSVRGGGHNIAGTALCDDGVVVDLTRMRAVIVDPAEHRAAVEGGATLSDFDAAAQTYGLATPLGINSTTGVAGLTLGGGLGWLSRKHGMTVDNLESVHMVTANGQVLRASADEHPDLYWAVRGGGGNFGVAARFEFKLHPVGPGLLCGLIAYPIAQAGAVLRQYRDFMAEAPDDLSVWVLLRKAPPLPFLPRAMHGAGIIVLALLYAGPPENGEALIKPLRRFGTPAGEHVGVMPYTAWQKAFDTLLAPGARNYWKSHNLTELPDGLFDTVTAYGDTLPTPQCEIFFGAIGGATCRPSPNAMAYAHRGTRFILNVHARWESPDDDQRCTAWARDFFQASTPFAGPGVYVNFLTADETDRVRAAYGRNYDRLAEIKQRYDPDNLFSANHNIAPARTTR
jgi:FAD/FMN-containing dehydrogenase